MINDDDTRMIVKTPARRMICQSCGGYFRRTRKYRKRTFGQGDLVEMIYRCRSGTGDQIVKDVVEMVFGRKPSDSQVGVWKWRIRRRGVLIPDGRESRHLNLSKNDK